MKEAMWKADPLGNFRFRDTTDPNQQVLFELEPDLTPLKRMLINQFKGTPVSIEEIEHYVAVYTAYLNGHIKQKTPQPMLKAQELTVKRPEGSKSGFKKGSIITIY
ncbi:hypothetical protein [Peribacillus frigoritolerans]|uniref:hypothetical protein n=1 Tax=Peribacillus frigoritolerans TaxID=450367 RepID=UPI00215A7DEE|nr:hypothetical protein [Peribacillus frigoritolerans]MCR8867451.1 hypothetical protein [Peribacillus frigoritolerans]